MTSHPRVILVLGMHRSGTSAVAGMLGDHGAVLPTDLMAPSPMNPKGFSESESISTLDDELMMSLGSSWHDWRPFAADPSTPEVEAFTRRAVDLVHEVFGDEDLVVLKDPRICRLVPFWHEVMRRAGREVLHLHVHRHPLEVAASLDRWAGYGTAYGELLWLRYVLDAEAATRGTCRTFVSYDQVLANPAAAARRVGMALELTWPRQDPAGESFVDTQLKRSAARDAEAASPWSMAALRVVEEWAAHGEIASQHGHLDELRAALDAGSQGFGRVVDQGREFDIRVRQLTRQREINES